MNIAPPPVRAMAAMASNTTPDIAIVPMTT